MTSSENSALVALSELRNLEAGRVAKEEAERLARLEAERQAQEAAERRVREEAERRAQEEADRIARERAEREAREREERIRVQEAEARARAEQEARLQEEQMRIDAQMRSAERQNRPKWPMYAIPVLVLLVGGIGYFAYDSNQKAAEQARLAEERAAAAAEQARLADEEKARKLEERDAQIAAITEEISRLKGELESADNDEDRARIAEEIKAQQEAMVDGKAPARKRRSSRSGSKSTGKSTASAADKEEDAPPAKPIVQGRKDKVSMGGGDDPLSGL